VADFGIPIAPGWVMLILMAAASAAAFKLLFGKQARGLLQCILISIIGFTIGEILAENVHLPIALPQIGDVHWIEALIVGWLLLFIVGRSRLW
jgi:uncharacterized membrane protein YjjP (DUF1212 family)